MPDTVVETLEAIRLFLSVPKMSFVIAADEDRVADAIATRFPADNPSAEGEETPARLYLHKIVQTSVPVPALSDFDTEAYLVLLQIRKLVEVDEYDRLVADVAAARREGSGFDSVVSMQRSEFVEQRNSASRIRPIVHEKTRGNPRRIKRFLNDLSVRLSIATKRGISLDAATIAKLMVLEQYFRDDFRTVTDWLREQTLRTNLEALESAAGTPPEEGADAPVAATTAKSASESSPKKPASVKKAVAAEDLPKRKQEFSDGLIRWARLSPALAKKDIAPYLVFAASFKSLFLASESLPESIRNMATQLVSKSPAEARRVTDVMISSVQSAGLGRLVAHIGGVIADDPQKQSAGVSALLRISRVRPEATASIIGSLNRIKPTELKAGGLIALRPTDAPDIRERMRLMAEASGRDELINAYAAAMEDH